MLGDECGFAIVAEEAGGNWHGAAGIEHVNHRLAVVGRNFYGGMRAAGGRAADEQRQLEPLPLHLAGHVNHLVERGRDKATEADEIGFLCRGALEDFFTGNHHAEVDDLVVPAGQDDADDVFADVVHVALDGGENDFSLRLGDLARGNKRGLLGLHEGREVSHGLLHDAGGFDHLGQKHFAGAEEIPDHAHAVHQRALNHQQRTAQLDAGFFGVDLDIRVNALDQRVRAPLFDGAVAPLFSFLFARNRASALELFAKVHQAFRGVGTAIEQHIRDQHLQLGFDLFIHYKHAVVDDAHVHARGNGVIKKGGVHGFAYLVVASEAERNVGDST